MTQSEPTITEQYADFSENAALRAGNHNNEDFREVWRAIAALAGLARAAHATTIDQSGSTAETPSVDYDASSTGFAAQDESRAARNEADRQRAAALNEAQANADASGVPVGEPANPLVDAGPPATTPAARTPR